MKPPIEYRKPKIAAPTEAEIVLARIRAKTRARVKRHRAKLKAKKS